MDLVEDLHYTLVERHIDSVKYHPTVIEVDLKRLLSNEHASGDAAVGQFYQHLVAQMESSIGDRLDIVDGFSTERKHVVSLEDIHGVSHCLFGWRSEVLLLVNRSGASAEQRGSMLDRLQIRSEKPRAVAIHC